MWRVWQVVPSNQTIQCNGRDRNMTNYQIPPEAVEAAAKVLYGERKLSWDELGLSSLANNYRIQARAAIRAADEAKGMRVVPKSALEAAERQRNWVTDD